MQQSDLYYQTLHQSQGLYTMELRLLTIDEQDTGVFKQLTVEVVDPCMSPSILIDESVFKTPPTITLE